MMHYQKAVAALNEVEHKIVYAKACADILHTDAWKVLSDALMKRESENIRRLIWVDDNDPHHAGMAKGVIRTCRFLLELPKAKVEKLDELQHESARLRKEIEMMRAKGLDRLPPDVRKQVSQVRSQLQELSR